MHLQIDFIFIFFLEFNFSFLLILRFLNKKKNEKIKFQKCALRVFSDLEGLDDLYKVKIGVHLLSAHFVQGMGRFFNSLYVYLFLLRKSLFRCNRLNII